MSRVKQKTGKYVECRYCGKTVYKTATNYNRNQNHYCSNECQIKYQHLETYEYRICEICNLEFEIRKKLPNRFCSVRCQNHWQRQNVGKLNPKYDRKTIKCSCCDNQIEIIDANLKRHSEHFCSNQCRKKWYAEVWSQDETWREESRKRAVRILNQNPTKTLTRPQVKINDMLSGMGIKYRNEEPFKYYSIDNYLPEYNLAIEVMGDFWHTNPMRYDEIRYLQQSKVLSRDKAKKTYLKRYHNIKVLYLWEKDIMENIDMCKALTRVYVELAGELDNYHSFNYEQTVSGIRLKDNLVIPYQDISSTELKKYIKNQVNA